jgi:hypothetical protein
MSHHYSGPNIGFPRGDARLDLSDLYAFPKPGDPDKSILIMNVQPSIGLNPPGPTSAEPFAPEARYELKIDTDGDAVANISYEMHFSSLEGGEQSATLRRVEGAQAAETGAAGKIILEGVPVSTGHEAHVTQAGEPPVLCRLAQRSLLLRCPGHAQQIPVYQWGFFRRQRHL